MRKVLNTYVKKVLQSILSLFHLRLITQSDFSKNGLKPYMLEFFLVQSKGILHIGAHSGQEAAYYSKFDFPVTWIEANPAIFEELQINASRYGQKAICALISDINEEETIFYLTSNDSESASMFRLAEKHDWSELENTTSITLKSKRLDSLFKSEDLIGLDFWIVDVQGSELQVIRSAGNLITDYCKFALVEVSTSEYYKGGSLWPDVKSKMNSLGFFELWAPSTTHEEVLFINSKTSF